MKIEGQEQVVGYIYIAGCLVTSVTGCMPGRMLPVARPERPVYP